MPTIWLSSSATSCLRSWENKMIGRGKGGDRSVRITGFMEGRVEMDFDICS